MVDIQADCVIITGIMVDNQKNRDYALMIGAGDIPFPPPYKDSVRGRCKMHGGKVFIGPELEQVRRKRAAAGQFYIVVCLICATVAFGVGGPNSPQVVSLSHKDSWKGEL